MKAVTQLYVKMYMCTTVVLNNIINSNVVWHCDKMSRYHGTIISTKFLKSILHISSTSMHQHSYSMLSKVRLVISHKPNVMCNENKMYFINQVTLHV